MKETTIRFWYSDNEKGEVFTDIDLKYLGFNVNTNICIHKQADYLIDILSFYVGIRYIKNLGAICYLSEV